MKNVNSANKAAKEKLSNMKYEIATELGVDLSQGGELKSRDAGSVGGALTKKVWDSYKNTK